MPKIAALQLPFSDDVTERTIATVEEAARDGAQIICLQELFNAPYFCQEFDEAHFARAEAIPGPTSEQICELAKRLGVVIVAPYFERRAAGLYHNSAIIADADGSLAGVYRKMHIPDDPQFHEKFYFAPGDPEQGFPAFDTQFGRIAVLICWDQWFPEAARLATLAGAELLCYPTAIGWIEDERENPEGDAMKDAWITMIRSHAIANGVFVVAPNRVGVERSDKGHIEFWGHSLIVRPDGVVSANGSAAEGSVTAEVDFGFIEKHRQIWPYLRDRRIESYGGMSERFLDADDFSA